jgi:hypothetical protein
MSDVLKRCCLVVFTFLFTCVHVKMSQHFVQLISTQRYFLFTVKDWVSGTMLLRRLICFLLNLLFSSSKKCLILDKYGRCCFCSKSPQSCIAYEICLCYLNISQGAQSQQRANLCQYLCLDLSSMSTTVHATFNNISVILWRSVLFAEETGVLGENHRTVASRWQ